MVRQQRLALEGVVVSDKMDRTVVVRVERLKQHPVYGKVLRASRRYLAHDEASQCRVGDRVRIRESRPLSRRKRWVVEEILERSPVPELAAESGGA